VGSPLFEQYNSKMNSISHLLPLTNIVVDAEFSSKKRLFEEVSAHIEKNQSIKRSVIFDSLLSREKLGSTGLGYGVAIPHGRIKTLQDAIGIFVRTKVPIAFDAPDGNPVNLIFVLLVPEKATDQHLQILGELAQMFSDRGFRDELLKAADANAIHQLFTGWQANVQGQRSTTI
jgi:nitrogen PTS system EIIA component